jgi:1,4-alpha-glucan branching enzyme
MACKAFDDGVNLRKGAPHLRADRYIKNMVSRLDEAESLMDLDPVSLLVIDVGASGGNKVVFLEKILKAAEKARIQIQTPAEYICKLDAITFQTVVPEYSSSLTDGYAHELLNEQNSWIYKHVFCSQERMIDLAGRFSESGISARALNQAAREILLAQSSDWLAMVSHDSSYAMERMEYHLRNFNTIYEFMGSNHISTKWLTKLEQSDNIFPNINYRSFRRKT